MESSKLLVLTRARLEQLGYRPESIEFALDSIVAVLMKFANKDAAFESFDEGFHKMVLNRFADAQFTRFIHHIDPEVSILFRDFDDEYIFAPLEDWEKDLMPADEVAEFEKERREYLLQTIEHARHCYSVLGTELAFAPLFGVHYVESKRSPVHPTLEKVKRPRMVFTPMGGQPCFRRKRKVR